MIGGVCWGWGVFARVEGRQEEEEVGRWWVDGGWFSGECEWESVTNQTGGFCRGWKSADSSMFFPSVYVGGRFFCHKSGLFLFQLV